jgi:hypothetical protein
VSHLSDKDGSDKDGLDKDLPDEQQLDEYLRGGSAVSQQYRQLRSSDVPAELDRLVLRHAQEAVKARPAKSRAWTRWAGPLALAASTVLVVSIVIESGVHEETYIAVPASAPADPPPKQEAAQPNEAQEKATAGGASDENVVQLVPVQPVVIEDDFVDSPPAPMVAEAPAPAPATLEDRRLALQRIAPPPVAAPVAQAPAESTPPEEVTVRSSAPPATRNSTPMAVSAQAQEEDTRLEEIIMTAQKRRGERKQNAGPRNTVAAPAAADSAREADQTQDEPRNYSDPEQWLRDIRQLRKEDKHEEADREWRRFRYMFPSYEVADTDPARGALR